MGKHGCSVFKCSPDRRDGRHRFPHPKKFPQIFLQWMQLLGNLRLQKVPDETVYAHYRVCSKHFKAEDFGPNRMLKKTAIPSLYIPLGAGVTWKEKCTIFLEHDYCKRQGGQDELPPSLSGTEDSLADSHNETMKSKCTTPEPPSLLRRDECAIPLIPGVGILNGLGVRSTQTLTPKAKALYKQAYYYKRKCQRINKRAMSFKERLQAAERLNTEQSFATVAKNLSTITFNFFKRQVECAGKRSKGRRFSVEDKILALALYKRSPTAYKLLAAIFALPSRVTLQKLLARIPIKAGINEVVFDALKGIGKRMSQKNKLCMLMFDEMALSPSLQYNQHRDVVHGFEDFGTHRTQKIANHVQVFMLRSVTGSWKQPVAYTFVQGGVKGPNIENMLTKIVKLAKNAGFTILATVCDQGTNNVSAINGIVKKTQRKNNTNEYVMDIDGDIIIPLYDAPHLLKSVRNNLLNKDIYYVQDGVSHIAKWEHISMAYVLDNFSGYLRAMPKLTDYHVDPKKIKKMKVACAVQVFSHSVASAMNLLIGNDKFSHNGKRLEENARGTVNFVKFFDDLFDSVNGSAHTSKQGKPLRTAVVTSQEHSVQDIFWQSALPILKSMYVIKKGQKVVLPCFTNWQRTLAGMCRLKIILRTHGVKLFKCRHFNQDPIENFFGQIRQRGRRATNPSCVAFEHFYKSLLVNNLVSKHSLGSNCEEDNTNILISLQQFITQGLPDDTNEDSPQPKTLNFPKVFNPLRPLETVALGYVAGYMVKLKGQLNKSCPDCTFNVLSRQDFDRVNNIMDGKDMRPLPKCVAPLYKQAKDIFNKKQKVRNAIKKCV